jgi:hypothetical protein
MIIEQEILDAVKDLISSGTVNTVRALEGQTYPYVIVHKISSPRDYDHDGNVGTITSHIDVKVFGSTYIQAKDIAIEIYALETYNSDTVSSIEIANEIDLYDDTTKAFFTNLDFKVQHYETGGS